MTQQDKIRKAPTLDAFMGSLRDNKTRFVMFEASHQNYALRIISVFGEGNIYTFTGVDSDGNEHTGCYDFGHKEGWMDRPVDSVDE